MSENVPDDPGKSLAAVICPQPEVNKDEPEVQTGSKETANVEDVLEDVELESPSAQVQVEFQEKSEQMELYGHNFKVTCL